MDSAVHKIQVCKKISNIRSLRTWALLFIAFMSVKLQSFRSLRSRDLQDWSSTFIFRLMHQKTCIRLFLPCNKYSCVDAVDPPPSPPAYCWIMNASPDTTLQIISICMQRRKIHFRQVSDIWPAELFLHMRLYLYCMWRTMNTARCSRIWAFSSTEATVPVHCTANSASSVLCLKILELNHHDLRFLNR